MASVFLVGLPVVVRLRTGRVPVVEDFDPAHKRERTLVAALIYWRDQVLIEADDEIESGEWGSIEHVNQWITELGGQP